MPVEPIIEATKDRSDVVFIAAVALILVVGGIVIVIMLFLKRNGKGGENGSNHRAADSIILEMRTDLKTVLERTARMETAIKMQGDQIESIGERVDEHSREIAFIRGRGTKPGETRQ
jgi:hypothetical protein